MYPMMENGVGKKKNNSDNMGSKLEKKYAKTKITFNNKWALGESFALLPKLFSVLWRYYLANKSRTDLHGALQTELGVCDSVSAMVGRRGPGHV